MRLTWLIRGIVLAGVSAAAVSQTAPGTLPQAPTDLAKADTAALDDFNRRAADYMKGERDLPASKLKPTNNIQELDNNRRALQAAIQAWRPNAKQGDIFTPAAAAVFRKLLTATLTGPHGKKIRASLNHAEPAAPANLQVNGSFPNHNGRPLQSVPPTLLKNLPILPKGLEYSIVGKRLVLRDANANLVVDYLPDALP